MRESVQSALRPLLARNLRGIRRLSKIRRFRVDSLSGLSSGDSVALPETEAAHIRVLRLKSGAALELFDNAGNSATAGLIDGDTARIDALILAAPKCTGRLILATAWPKGKRAATLVEKCSELGVDEILPIRWARSVVSKDSESEGITRLRRIAAEAAKQSGRNDAPEILAEKPFDLAVRDFSGSAVCVLLDPRAERSLLEVLREHRSKVSESALVLFVGPEGGFAPEELDSARKCGLISARLVRNILRIETAALAACAIAAAVLHE